jgi:predicted Zn-dependent protease
MKRLVVAVVCALPLLASAGKGDLRLKDGDAAVLLGDLDAAEKAYRDAHAAEPGNVTASVRLAYVLGHNGKEAEGVKLLEDLVAGKKAPPEAHQILGTLLVKRREWKRAAEAFEAYLAVEKDDLQTRLELARVWRVLAEEGDAAAKTKAIAEYERVMKDAGDDDATRRQAQEEIFGVKYGESGRAFRDGKQAFVSGDYRAAVTKLELVVGKHPEIEEAQYLLGMAYVSPDVGRRADAMKAWDKAPTVKEAQLQLGGAFHDDGNLAAAETKLKKALELDKSYQEAWFRLGSVYAEKGSYDDAVSAWRKAAQIDPRSETGKWAQTKISMVAGTGGGAFQEGQVVDPASETAMGQKIADAYISRFGLVEDPRLEARIEKIWGKLVAATDRGDIPYKIYVLNWDVVNAFTIYGGRVFLCKGLVDVIRTRMGDKDEYYAAILGHELAHATLRHLPEGIKLAQTVLNDPSRSGELDRSLAGVATGMTRNSEYEADQYGALYMYRAGYNPRYAMSLHAEFRKAVGEIPPGMDHPPFAEREARVKDFLIDLRGRTREFDLGVKALAEQDYDEAARRFEVFLSILPRSAPGHLNLALARHRQAMARLGADQKWKRTTDLDPDSRAQAIQLHSAAGPEKLDPRVDRARLREAAAEYRMALKIDPAYALARVNYGAVLLDLGKVPDARKLLEAAVKKTPKLAGAWNNLGVAYLLGKDVKKALAAFETAVKLDAKLADPWFNLGGLHVDGGDIEKALAAYDEYTKRDSGTGWAKAVRARKAELAQRRSKK